MNYSVAIRTLGKNPEILRQELESIARQTILPEKVVIYIAEGYPKPVFNVMGEIYVETAKGMMTQRALDYNEIDTPLIFLLDDDVELAPRSAETLINQLVENNADCVAADTFQNHRMSTLSKIKAAVGSLVFPHFNQKCAFRLHNNGAFSYINNPTCECYPSDSAAGPAALWRKDSLLYINLKSELWIDSLGFAYGDDELLFYKLVVNGKRLFVSFNSGIKNLDAKTSSGDYHKNKQKFYIRTKANVIRWHRMHCKCAPTKTDKCLASLNFGLKITWFSVIYLAVSIRHLNFGLFTNHLKGLRDGNRYLKSTEYQSLPPYKF